MVTWHISLVHVDQSSRLVQVFNFEMSLQKMLQCLVLFEQLGNLRRHLLTLLLVLANRFLNFNQEGRRQVADH